MENPQVNARISPELDVEFDRWVERAWRRPAASWAWNIVTEALAARREGRATFSRPELPSPADLQHLTAKIDTMVTELDRVLRQNGKREAELARSAKAGRGRYQRGADRDRHPAHDRVHRQAYILVRSGSTPSRPPDHGVDRIAGVGALSPSCSGSNGTRGSTRSSQRQLEQGAL